MNHHQRTERFKILAYLSQNPRLTAQQIGSQSGIPTEAVVSHLYWLEENKFIVRYRGSDARSSFITVRVPVQFGNSRIVSAR